MGKALILYATGTGNSWRAAARIGERLEAAGWGVESRELRAGAELTRGAFAGDLLVLVYPTLGFGTPPGLYAFLRGFGAAKGRRVPAAVFATWGGHPGAALRQGAALLRRRGFSVIAAGGAAYPFNWTQVINPPDTPRAAEKVVGGDADVGRFADRLAAALKGGAPGPAPRQPLTTLLFLPISWLYKSTGAKGMAAMYGADERCTACGICARDCPSGAIRMAGSGNRRRPRWNTRCWACNRCINVCPEAAIQMSPVRTGVHLLINVGIMVAGVIGLNRLAAVLAQPAWITVPGWIIAFIAVVVIGTFLQMVALEPLFFALEGIPGLRKLIGRSWTARFRRYRCEGFKPGKAR
jgi:NAD-dependent dihydropyrimidine dehydrogenase PreA subunit